MIGRRDRADAGRVAREHEQAKELAEKGQTLLQKHKMTVEDQDTADEGCEAKVK